MSSSAHASAESAAEISPTLLVQPSEPTTQIQIEEAPQDHELHDVAITMVPPENKSEAGSGGHKKKHKHGHHSHSSSSKEVTKNTVKFAIMIVLVFIFFVAEIVMGYLGNSLALISDAFHMLSDGMSLVIGLVALRLSTKGPGKKLSYGWGRTEILGGLINGVFLLSVVLFVYMEAIQRFFNPEPIDKPYYVLGVGILGLIVNIIGMIMFGGHHHHGHDHGHDHGHSHGHSHSHGHKKKDKKKKKKMSKKKQGDKHEHEEGHQHIKHEDSDEHKHDHEHDHEEHHHEHDHHEEDHNHEHDHDHDHEHSHEHKHEEKGQKQKKKKLVNLNMAGVFLHVLGDFLGSIGVVIAAALSWAFDPTKNRWVVYIDPSISVILNTIILFSTIPLVKNCAKVLLQIVPDEIDVATLKDKILAVKGVVDIHEFHIWKLVNTKVVCSIHILVDKNENFMMLAGKIKNIFHENSVHSSTIQPEFVDTSALKSPGEASPTKVAELCQLTCSVDCQEDWCCPPSKEQKVPLLHDHDHH